MMPKSIQPGRRGGFTLMEVLISIGIFAVGMVAVASIFPVALTVQRNTIEAMHGVQAVRNAKALIAARKLDALDPDFAQMYPATPVTEVQTLPPPIFDKWSINDRGYPRSTSKAFACDFYWTPLVQDLDGVPGTTGDIRFFAFILKKDNSTTYLHNDATSEYADEGADADTAIPKVRRITAIRARLDVIEITQIGIEIDKVFRLGDQILDNNGNTFIVREISIKNGRNLLRVKGLVVDSPNVLQHIWYGEPGSGGGQSPTVKIEMITDAVQ
jgi:prepilin-type N-terminal cleavage/methylation domain-containing protein